MAMKHSERERRDAADRVRRKFDRQTSRVFDGRRRPAPKLCAAAVADHELATRRALRQATRIAGLGRKLKRALAVGDQALKALSLLLAERDARLSASIASEDSRRG